jgi:dTMP kinase
MTTGRFIALEGGEGSGKSTQAARLAAALGAVATREPGGTRIGALVRAIVLDPAGQDLTDRAEALLYAADRAQHIAEVVRPALAAGRHVVTDRSPLSSIAYQGYGRGIDPDVIRGLSGWAIDECWPELAVLLDIAPGAALGRLDRSFDRLESEGLEFHERVRDGYLKMAAAEPDRWVVVDADQPAADVATAVRRAVAERLGL